MDSNASGGASSCVSVSGQSSGGASSCASASGCQCQ